MASPDPLEAAAKRAAELAEAPVAPTHTWVVENLRITVDAGAKGLSGPTETVDAAQKAGLRFVGRKSESAPGRTAILSDVFVEPGARVVVSVRSRTEGGDFAAVFSKYWITTVFDDSTAIQTSSLARPHLRSSERVVVRAGTGDLVKDLADHLAAVEARGRGGVVLPARDGVDVVRVLRVYYRRCVSAEVVAAMRGRGM